MRNAQLDTPLPLVSKRVWISVIASAAKQPRKIGLIYVAVLLLSFSQLLYAAEQNFAFENASQQQEFDDLLKEIRCVTCPNQNIADSHAPVAKAMQEEIYTRLQKGESTLSIREYLLSHYGDYVFYRPLVKKRTLLLWSGPFLLFLLGLSFYLKTVFTVKRTPT